MNTAKLTLIAVWFQPARDGEDPAVMCEGRMTADLFNPPHLVGKLVTFAVPTELFFRFRRVIGQDVILMAEELLYITGPDDETVVLGFGTVGVVVE